MMLSNYRLYNMKQFMIIRITDGFEFKTVYHPTNAIDMDIKSNGEKTVSSLAFHNHNNTSYLCYQLTD